MKKKQTSAEILFVFQTQSGKSRKKEHINKKAIVKNISKGKCFE